MAAGVPIVATDAPGIDPVILRDEETALLVPPRDSAALASAVVAQRRDEELRAGLVRRATEIVRLHGDFDRELDTAVDSTKSWSLDRRRGSNGRDRRNAVHGRRAAVLLQLRGLTSDKRVELALSDWAGGASSLWFLVAPGQAFVRVCVGHVPPCGRVPNAARALAASGRGGGGVRPCAGVLGRSGDLGYPLGTVPLLVEA